MIDEPLSPTARALLEAARSGDDPTAADRARIDAAFAAKLAPLGLALVGTASAGGIAMKGGARVAAKASAVALAAAALVAIGMYAIRTTQSAAGPAPSHAAGVTDSTRAAANPPTHDNGEQAPPSPAPVADSKREPEHALAERHAAHPSRTPDRREDSLPAELRLIARANAELSAQHFAAARSVLDEHAARFPDGVLREERAGLHVLAACGISVNPAALAERARFLRNAPSSVLAQKVRAACAGSHANAEGRGTP